MHDGVLPCRPRISPRGRSLCRRIRLHGQTYRCGSAKKEEFPVSQPLVDLDRASSAIAAPCSQVHMVRFRHALNGGDAGAREFRGDSRLVSLRERSWRIEAPPSRTRGLMWMYSIDRRTLFVTPVLVGRSRLPESQVRGCGERSMSTPVPSDFVVPLGLSAQQIPRGLRRHAGVPGRAGD